MYRGVDNWSSPLYLYTVQHTGDIMSEEPTEIEITETTDIWSEREILPSENTDIED